MANEDNTRQMNQANGQNEDVLAAVRSLDSRLTSIEEIILARLNDTRPFEQQMIARLDNLIAGLATMREELTTMREELATVREELATMREELATMREELAALRKDHERFREETNDNFRKMRKLYELSNNDYMYLRAEHSLLENRVEKLEDRAA